MPGPMDGSVPGARVGCAHTPVFAQYLELASWTFLEPGLDCDRVQLSFLLDFYWTGAKFNLISFFLSAPSRCREEDAWSGCSPWEATCCSERVCPFGSVRWHSQLAVGTRPRAVGCMYRARGSPLTLECSVDLAVAALCHLNRAKQKLPPSFPRPCLL